MYVINQEADKTILLKCGNKSGVCGICNIVLLLLNKQAQNKYEQMYFVSSVAHGNLAN